MPASFVDAGVSAPPESVEDLKLFREGQDVRLQVAATFLSAAFHLCQLGLSHTGHVVETVRSQTMGVERLKSFTTTCSLERLDMRPALVVALANFPKSLPHLAPVMDAGSW
jgi:hypothetical protein